MQAFAFIPDLAVIKNDGSSICSLNTRPHRTVNFKRYSSCSFQDYCIRFQPTFMINVMAIGDHFNGYYVSWQLLMTLYDVRTFSIGINGRTAISNHTERQPKIWGLGCHELHMRGNFHLRLVDFNLGSFGKFLILVYQLSFVLLSSSRS